MKYLVNLETDGDGIYHVHNADCPYKPEDNYENLESTELEDAIEEAKEIVDSDDVKGCKHCT